jgi:hypothetical protein
MDATAKPAPPAPRAPIDLWNFAWGSAETGADNQAAAFGAAPAGADAGNGTVAA